jgi:hypothetical protein
VRDTSYPRMCRRRDRDRQASACFGSPEARTRGFEATGAERECGSGAPHRVRTGLLRVARARSVTSSKWCDVAGRQRPGTDGSKPHAPSPHQAIATGKCKQQRYSNWYHVHMHEAREMSRRSGDRTHHPMC